MIQECDRRRDGFRGLHSTHSMLCCAPGLTTCDHPLRIPPQLYATADGDHGVSHSDGEVEVSCGAKELSAPSSN